MPDTTPATPVAQTTLTTPATLSDNEGIKDFAHADEARFRELIGLPKSEAPASSEPAPKEPLAQDAAAEKSSPEPTTQTEEKVEEAAPEKAPEAEAPKPAPLTKFAVYDNEGELEVPDLFFNFKANGKEYEKVPLEKVVLLAQMGFSNQEREAQVLGAKKFVADAQQHIATQQEALDAYQEYFRRIFEEPDFFDAARDEYAKQNTPEMRARRAEERVTKAEERERSVREDGARQQFVQTTLVPTVMKLLESYPSVSQEEVIGRYSMLTAPLLVRGAVPVQSLGTVQSLVENDLANWAKETHAVRELEKQRNVADVKRVKEVAQTQIQQQKNRLARSAAPPVASAAPMAPSNAKKEFATVEEWMSTVLPTQAP